MSRKHLLYAFVHNNFGDDLFIKILCERYPNENFYIGLDPNKANSSFKKIDNLYFDKKLFKIDKLLKKESFINNHIKIKFNLVQKIYFKYLNSFNSSIYVVGSAFIQNNANKDYTNLLLLEKRVTSSNKFFLINSNFGPYVDEKYLNISKNIISKMTHATFRDKYSYNLFKDIKIVSYAPDLVLTLKEKKIVSTNQVMISVMDLGDEYFRLIQNFIKELNNKGLNCKLVSFCKSQNDEKMANQLIESIKDYKIDLLSYNGNIDEIIEEFNKSSYIISTRFHSLILSLALNKPFLPFIYSNKTDEVLNDINYKGIRIKNDTIKDINIKDTINYLLNSKALNIDTYKLRANNQFKSLDFYLKDIK